MGQVEGRDCFALGRRTLQALQTARTLAEHKIDTRLVTLPLSETQISARQELTERFGLTASVGPKELAKLLAGRPAEEIKAAEALLATAKIDVNDYIAAGHTREDFERLLAEASTPIEFGVRSLPEGAEEEERNRLLEPILGEISEQSPLEQARLLKLVQERIGGGVSMAALKEQIRAIQIITLSHKPMNVGAVLLGGALFGAGWAIMGFCPGTSLGALGEGRWHAVFAILGMVVGAALYAEIYPVLKATVLAWKDFGKIGLPEAMGLSQWVIVPAFWGGIIALFFWFERKNCKSKRGT